MRLVPSTLNLRLVAFLPHRRRGGPGVQVASENCLAKVLGRRRPGVVDGTGFEGQKGSDPD